MCALFHNTEDEYSVLLPFMKEGFEAGDRAVHIIDEQHRAERLRRPTEDGIDTQGAQRNGKLDVFRVKMPTWGQVRSTSRP